MTTKALEVGLIIANLVALTMIGIASHEVRKASRLYRQLRGMKDELDRLIASRPALQRELDAAIKSRSSQLDADVLISPRQDS